MKINLLEQLTRPQREAVESAGYRVMRWMAAREVLRARTKKGRIEGALGDFLTHWLSLAPVHEAGQELRLSFEHVVGQEKLKLAGGNMALAASSLEHALLHLPALRPFWNQELRQQHFEALRILVPQAWLLDMAEVPPGAVIQGLGTISWEQTQRVAGQDLEIQGQRGNEQLDWPLAMAARDSVLTSRPPAGVTFDALYGRNDKDQVVLRSLEAAP